MPEKHSEHAVWLAFGYAPVVKRGGPCWELVEPLQKVLGEFSSIEFQVLRFGEEFFELTMTRTGVPYAHGECIVETVAGKVGDLLQLKRGEFATIHKVSSEAHQVKVHFWSNK